MGLQRKCVERPTKKSPTLLAPSMGSWWKKGFSVSMHLLFPPGRFELKLAISKGKQVVLYPDNDEPKHILNIKRGIISALLVPPETEEDKQVLFLVRIFKGGDSGLPKSSSQVRAHPHLR